MKFPDKEQLKHILNNHKGLFEMRYAPDNSGYPLTRRQVEKLLSRYERREDEDGWNDDPEYRSIDGWKRARWYPPELIADYEPDAKLTNVSQERPAKLMPYDYYYNVYRSAEINPENHYDIDNDDDKENPVDMTDWKGQTNTY